MATRQIKILPPHIVNRIAAGEVVERPASVVKELVENALDAGATKIEIFASAGGRTLRIADNGAGMSPEDAAMAFYNHATSKIDTDSDLERIETLGFRGEALASISAISRLTCFTRTQDAPSGSKVTFNETAEPVVNTTGCSPGTVMEVADLFFNTPARLKFLKRPQTELGHIEETVQNLALSHPEVQFSLTLNDQLTVKTRGSGELQSAVTEVLKLSSNDSKGLIAITREDQTVGMTLAGFVSSPSQPKSTKRWIITFVNGRLVKCPVLSKAIETAYTSLIPHGKYPLAVLFVNMPADEVDVNVHPTKREVRYASAKDIFGFVQHSIRSTLEANGHAAFFGLEPPTETHSTTGLPLSSGSYSPPRSHSGHWSSAGGGYPSHNPYRPSDHPSEHPSHGPLPTQAALAFYQPTDATKPVQPSETGIPGPTWKVIGQLFNTYILLETPQGLMVVDQHIASERYFFERLTRSTMDTPTETVQKLIGVHPLTLSPLQADLLSANHEPFEQLGFGYTVDKDALSVTLTSMPILYQERQPEDLFESLLAQLEETGHMRLDLDLLIATLSCHSAVRAGDTLSIPDMSQVIGKWLDCKLPWTCPHGRPIAHTIKTEQLNHFFERPSLPVNALG